MHVRVATPGVAARDLLAVLVHDHGPHGIRAFGRRAQAREFHREAHPFAVGGRGVLAGHRVVPSSGPGQAGRKTAASIAARKRATAGKEAAEASARSRLASPVKMRPERVSVPMARAWMP